MVKTLVSLTIRQARALAKEATDLQIPKSELLRRIMDKYLDSDKKITAKEVKVREKKEED